MSLNIGIGFSDGSDAHAVGVNACQDAFRKIKGSHPIFGMVFISSNYDHKKAIDGIRSVLKGVPILGASSAEGIVCGSANTKRSIIVILISGKDVFFSSYLKGLGSEVKKEDRKIGEKLTRELGGKPDLSFMFTDVLSGFEQHKLVNSLYNSTGAPVFGGGTADGLEFKRTFQYFKDKVETNSAIFGSMKGDFNYGIGMDHGMLPAGIPRSVTKSKGVSVYHINGKPAVTMYGEYFGYKDLQRFTAEPLAKMSVSYPLGFRWDIIEDEHITIRAPLFLRSDGSLICTDHIPEGSNVQLMIGDKEEAQKSVRRAAKKAQTMLGEEERASVAILVSSAGRKYLYGNSMDDEVKDIRSIVGDVPVVGFYSYGSICASEDSLSEHSVFQDNSVAICLLK
ncbi:MAG: FIST signal transduction protein [Patescibacteria group bacterium]